MKKKYSSKIIALYFKSKYKSITYILKSKQFKEMNNLSYCSNESSDYEINNDTLDKLYKDQLQTLRDLVLKQNQTSDLELCRKWLKIFGKTTKSEKIARNCLCSLMQQQLQEYGYLGTPFIDLQNCNRDLNCVLRELDNNQSSVTEQTGTIETFASHHKPPEFQILKSELTKNDTISECLENETLAENALLRHELETMRLQLTEKQIENLKLKEIAEKHQLENTKYSEKLHNLKTTFREALEGISKDIDGDDPNLSFKIFEKVFKIFSEDGDFYEHIKKSDSNFELVVNKIFEKELNKRKSLIARHVSRKFTKSKIKLKEKYDRRLRVQSWAQRLQLKLVKLKCFSVLRQIFINTQNGGSETMWDLLKVLEDKYQSIVNEIL